MPGKMDRMQAMALASRMRKQYPRATTGQLKGMIDGTGNPMGEDPMKLRGMTPTGYQGSETGPAYRPISELSEMELNQLGITRKDPVESLRRMESSVAYGESDPMTGMTETEAFPESPQPISSRPSISATYDKMFPGGYQPQPSLVGAATGMMMDAANMPAMARGDFMEELTQSTDYGNAYADTISTRKDSASIEDLADVPMMYDTAQQKAMSMYQRTGRVPPSVAQELGSLAGLMDIKRDLEDVGSRELRESMMNFEREIQPGMDDSGDRDGR